MASNAVVEFEKAGVPTFFRAPSESATNTLAALAPKTFPYLSIKGKRFAIVRNKEETPIMRLDDDETPANSIEVVMVNTAPNFSKVYYDKEWEEGDKEKPTCMSNDGIEPDPQSTVKQSKKCMTCPHNVWGTGKGGKGKACSDSLRLALSFTDSLNDPMMLRVPPASLKAATEYAAFLARKGAPMEGLVTKIKFDSEEATPKLQFSAVRYLTEKQYNEVLEVAKANITQQIVGTIASPQLAAPAKDEPEGDIPAAAEPEKVPAKPAKKAEAKVETKVEKAPKAEKAPTASTVSALAAKLKASMAKGADDAD